ISETGFLPKSPTVINDSGKNPVSRHPAHPRLGHKPKKPGFSQFFGCINILEKNPVSRPTPNLRNRVFAQITDCNQRFWKKPGFSPPRTSKTRT
ncbi:hypothetical protein, partial [Microcoleus sp. EPA2]|uniref:hypothetical protein n=1 Tax=Microcoleus sp. EPA2 TaxID=2841654 RepID=UPI00312BBE7A